LNKRLPVEIDLIGQSIEIRRVRWSDENPELELTVGRGDNPKILRCRPVRGERQQQESK